MNENLFVTVTMKQVQYELALNLCKSRHITVVVTPVVILYNPTPLPLQDEHQLNENPASCRHIYYFPTNVYYSFMYLKAMYLYLFYIYNSTVELSTFFSSDTKNWIRSRLEINQRKLAIGSNLSVFSKKQAFQQHIFLLFNVYLCSIRFYVALNCSEFLQKFIIVIYNIY